MLLAFDTATPRVTVAVHDGASVRAEAVSEQKMKHGEQLMPLVARVLDDAGVDRRELTRIAAGVGPGPFTGLRVGLVTARTLGFALGIPVLGVCTLDVIAVEAAEELHHHAGFAVATDARRKEVYLARYDADGRRLTDPVVGRPADLASVGPVVGEGAGLYPEHFPNAHGPERPSAGWLARAVVDERVALLDPEPLYLRRPDAAAPGARKPVLS